MNQFLDINFMFLSMKNSILSLKFTNFYPLFVGLIINVFKNIKI